MNLLAHGSHTDAQQYGRGGAEVGQTAWRYERGSKKTEYLSSPSGPMLLFLGMLFTVQKLPVHDT